MLLYEVLFNKKSRNYCEGELYLYPLVSDVKMALAAISDCDIEELETILIIAAEFHSNVEYSEEYNEDREKLEKVLNFLESFKRRFSEAVDKSILNTPKQTASAIAGNIINLITQDDQLGFEESVVILHSLRPIVDRLASESESESESEMLMNNIYFTGLSICERYNTYGINFVIIISSNYKWSIDQFIRGCNSHLDKIIYRGLSSILRSKTEIKKLDGKLKKDLKIAYKALVEKSYKFSLIERCRVSLF
jgi:hypothetical protein